MTPTCGDRGAKAANLEQESVFKVALGEKTLTPNQLVNQESSHGAETREGGLDADAPARAIIESQDREIAEKSGMPPLRIKSLKRSGKK